MKGVGQRAGVFGRTVILVGLFVVLVASPAGAHADGATPIVEDEPVGDYDISVWLEESASGPSTVIISQTEGGKLVSGPAPYLALMVDGTVVAENIELIAEDTGWWLAEIPVVEGTEVVVTTEALNGERTASVFPLEDVAPWWVHLVMVAGIASVLVLADRMIRQFARAVSSFGILERVGVRGNT